MRICRAPDCQNIAISQRTVCTKHKHRLRKSKTFDIPERVKKCEKLPADFVKNCKVHGLLKFDQVNIQHSKYREKRYKWYQCKECVSLKRQRLYWENPDKYRKRANENRKKHYEKLIKRDRKYKLQLLNQTQFNELLNKQNNCCAICKKPETAKVQQSRTIKNNTVELKRLAIDHCHKTGIVRGLLCQKCNTALGGFRDSIEILNSAIEYLTPFSSSLPSPEDSRACEYQPE